MTELEHTKIYRGGYTAPYLHFESDHCRFDTDANGRALRLKFGLASKGGGTTKVRVEVGLDDLPLILNTIASEIPEFAGILSKCAALASKRVIEQLVQASKTLSHQQEQLTSVVEKLELVQEFVSQKYNEAPAGEDKHEAAVGAQLDEAVACLGRLT